MGGGPIFDQFPGTSGTIPIHVPKVPPFHHIPHRHPPSVLLMAQDRQRPTGYWEIPFGLRHGPEDS